MRPKYAFDPIEFGEIRPIAENIDWLRLPLPMALDHINIYILHDDDGLTIIDTALKTDALKTMWRTVLDYYNKPVKRVLVTHFHPDHIGLAGWFRDEFGAELYMSRMSYVLTRMLQLDRHDKPRPEQIEYWRRAGYDQTWIDAKCSERPFQFLDSTALLGLGVRSVLEDDVFHAGGRDWQIRMSAGHAPDHVSLWHEDFVLIGDHGLPAITPVISVFASEPYADPLGEFVKTSAKLAQFANDEQMFLPGHNRPYFGGYSRLIDLSNHHHENLDKLRDALKEPKTMIETYSLLFKRKITREVEGFAISEATAHFNHLWLKGEIKIVETDPIVKWQSC